MTKNNSRQSTTSFVALIKGRETFAPELRNSQLARTIAAGYSSDYCDEVPEVAMACGCTDYHMADCSVMTGSHDYWSEAESAYYDNDY